MKYLLVGINAKYIHSNLAVHCLQSYARSYASVAPDVREYTINMQVSDILEDIYKEKPDFAAFSVYIWNVDIISRLIRDIKVLLPELVIYLGGPEVSYDSASVLDKFPEVQGIMLGEGEETLCELIDLYESGEAAADGLKKIKGLCIRNGAETMTTGLRSPIDLSKLPFPYDDLSEYKNRIIYYETSRGCPFGCAYCLSSVDKTVRFRSMELVEKEFLFFLDNEIPQVKLVDRTFNIDHERSTRMLRFLRDHDNGITNFHFEIAGDILTDEEIRLINSLRPGQIQLEIGVQSTNVRTLDAVGRHTDMDRLKENVKRLLEGGRVHIHLDLIAGLPFEDLTSFKKSFNEVYAMGGHELQLGFLKVLKGAPINDEVDGQSIRYTSSAPYEVLSTKYLSYEDICELKRVEEMLEIYHNSCQFIMSERFLLTMEASAYDMYLGLAEYYRSMDQPVIQCKRSVRYEMLLGYAAERHGLSEHETEKLRNLLTLDYYSREKAKARPGFAPGIEQYKDRIRHLTDKYKTPDIHIEPVTDTDNMAVFDYSARSPITGNAGMSYISAEVI